MCTDHECVSQIVTLQRALWSGFAQFRASSDIMTEVITGAIAVFTPGENDTWANTYLQWLFYELLFFPMGVQIVHYMWDNASAVQFTSVVVKSPCQYVSGTY